MRRRLVVDIKEKRARAAKMGIKDPRRKYEIEDMVRGDCLFAATASPTAVSCKARSSTARGATHTLVMRSIAGTARWIAAEHPPLDNF